MSPSNIFSDGTAARRSVWKEDIDEALWQDIMLLLRSGLWSFSYKIISANKCPADRENISNMFCLVHINFKNCP